MCLPLDELLLPLRQLGAGLNAPGSSKARDDDHDYRIHEIFVQAQNEQAANTVLAINTMRIEGILALLVGFSFPG